MQFPAYPTAEINAAVLAIMRTYAGTSAQITIRRERAAAAKLAIENKFIAAIAALGVQITAAQIPLYTQWRAQVAAGQFYDVDAPPAGAYVKPVNTPYLTTMADFTALKSGARIFGVSLPTRVSYNAGTSGSPRMIYWMRPPVLHDMYETPYLAEALPAYRNMTDPTAVNTDIGLRIKSDSSGTAGFLFDVVVPTVVIGTLSFIAMGGLMQVYGAMTGAAPVTPPVAPENTGTTGLVDATSGTIAPPPAVSVSSLPSDVLSFPTPQSSSSIIDAATSPINLSYLNTPLDAQIAAQTAQSAALLAPINTGNAMLTGLGLTSTTTTADLLTALTPADMGTILGGSGVTSLTNSLQKALPSQDKIAAAVKAAVAAGVAGSVKKAPAPVPAQAANNFWFYALGAGALLLIIKKG